MALGHRGPGRALPWFPRNFHRQPPRPRPQPAENPSDPYTLYAPAGTGSDPCTNAVSQHRRADLRIDAELVINTPTTYKIPDLRRSFPFSVCNGILETRYYRFKSPIQTRASPPSLRQQTWTKASRRPSPTPASRRTFTWISAPRTVRGRCHPGNRVGLRIPPRSTKVKLVSLYLPWIRM